MVAFACTIVAAGFGLLSAFWQHLSAGATISMMDALAYGTASARVGAAAMAFGWLAGGLSALVSLAMLLMIVSIRVMSSFGRWDTAIEAGSVPTLPTQPMEPPAPPQFGQSIPEQRPGWATDTLGGRQAHSMPAPRMPWAPGATVRPQVPSMPTARAPWGPGAPLRPQGHGPQPQGPRPRVAMPGPPPPPPQGPWARGAMPGPSPPPLQSIGPDFYQLR